MKERDIRIVFIVLALGFLAGAWIYFAVSDAPSAWGLVLTLVSSGVFAALRP